MESATVQANIQELEALRMQTRFWRWGISLTLLVIVVSCLFTLRSAVTGLTNEGATKTAFVQDLSDRMQKSALPTIEQMGTQALHEINFQAEVQKLNKRTPELTQASMEQVKRFGQELPERGKKVMDATFTAALKKNESKIRTMFPEATDAQVQALMTTLSNEAIEQAAGINDQLFASHKKAVDSILQDFATIRNTGAADAKGQTPTWDMALLIFDLARNDLKSLAAEEKKTTSSNNVPAKGAKK
jgi:spore coat protein CotF